MRYALVDQSGNVTNIIEWGGVGNWTPPTGQSAVLAAADVGVGWTYNGTSFVAPVPLPLTPEQQAAVDAYVAKLARRSDMDGQPDQTDLAARIKTATPAQIDNWIDTNVITLVAARAVLKAIVKYFARQAA